MASSTKAIATACGNPKMIDGIRVVRVWSYVTANEGFLRRILDYVSYMAAAVVAALFVRKVDVVIGTSPQFFTACAALCRKPL